MAKFPPADPKQRNALFIGVGLVALIYPFHSFWYSARQEELTAMVARVETLETQNRGAKLQAARGGADLEERMAAYERHVDKLEELIPASEEVPKLLNDMTRTARQLDVELNRMVPEPPEPGSFYTKNAFDMVVVGEYHAVGRFLAQVASLSRIITPVEMDIAVWDQPDLFPDMESPIVATFRIETYVLPDAGAPRPTPAAGG